MHHLHNKSMDQLLQAICRLETIEDCYAFFEDVCTIREIQDMAQRFDVAVMLDSESLEALSEPLINMKYVSYFHSYVKFLDSVSDYLTDN